MLKIAHIRKQEPEAVKELAAIFIIEDTKRQERELEKLKSQSNIITKKAALLKQ